MLTFLAFSGLLFWVELFVIFFLVAWSVNTDCLAVALTLLALPCIIYLHPLTSWVTWHPTGIIVGVILYLMTGIGESLYKWNKHIDESLLNYSHVSDRLWMGTEFEPRPK